PQRQPRGRLPGTDRRRPVAGAERSSARSRQRVSGTGTDHRDAYATRVAPRLGGFNATFVRIEIRRLLRNRRTVLVTVLVPVVLFLLLKANKRSISIGGAELTAATTMIGIAVYGAMLAATSGGAMVSIERALGWSRQL